MTRGILTILHFLSYETDITLYCIYGPNKDEPVFYESIKKTSCQLLKMIVSWLEILI